jgi:SHS2 domain-containing protein
MGYRFVEHGGEVEVELEASTEAGIFEAALRALAELIAADGEGESVVHEIELKADERALMLVDWVNELVFLAEVEQFVPGSVRSLEVAEGHLRASVAGHRGNPLHLVKAVTLSRLAFAREGGRWSGRVVLDV